MDFHHISLFYFRRFHVKDASQLSRLVEVDDVIIKVLVEWNPRDMARQIAETVNIRHSTVSDHLNKLGYRIKDQPLQNYLEQSGFSLLNIMK